MMINRPLLFARERAQDIRSALSRAEWPALPRSYCVDAMRIFLRAIRHLLLATPTKSDPTFLHASTVRTLERWPQIITFFRGARKDAIYRDCVPASSGTSP